MVVHRSGGLAGGPAAREDVGEGRGLPDHHPFAHAHGHFVVPRDRVDPQLRRVARVRAEDGIHLPVRAAALAALLPRCPRCSRPLLVRDRAGVLALIGGQRAHGLGQVVRGLVDVLPLGEHRVPGAVHRHGQPDHRVRRGAHGKEGRLGLVLKDRRAAAVVAAAVVGPLALKSHGQLRPVHKVVAHGVPPHARRLVLVEEVVLLVHGVKERPVRVIHPVEGPRHEVEAWQRRIVLRGIVGG